MSTYVVSDIHGELNRLEKLLEVISFSKEDDLYILGDVVDRGKNGIEILQMTMREDNIHMILGNHEYMMLQYFSGFATELDNRRWNRNGNYFTLAGIDKLSPQEKTDILSYLYELPDEIDLSINDKKYILLHGFLGDNTHDKVWNRPAIDEETDLDENTVIIVGHTPVCEYVCPDTIEEQYVYSKKLTENGKHFEIFHAKSFIDIDCCCGYEMSASRLACLRLEDLKEFYV